MKMSIPSKFKLTYRKFNYCYLVNFFITSFCYCLQCCNPLLLIVVVVVDLYFADYIHDKHVLKS